LGMVVDSLPVVQAATGAIAASILPL
jgi:hypothetical protein